MTLGACYSLSDLTVTKRSAIKFTPADLDDGPSATEFGAFVVRDIETMKETLGIDLKIDANYLSFGGASASFDLENSVQQRTDSLTVVIKTSTTFGRKGITDDSLRPEAQALLGDAKSFIDAFGTYVIDQVTLGASVSAVLTISDVDTSTQNDISTELAAHGGSGPVSGGLTAKVNQEIQRAANSGRLSINLFATGGPGLGGLKDSVATLTTTTNGIDAILKALETFIGQFNKTNASDIMFNFRPLSEYGLNPEAVDLWSLEKERRLEDIVKLYRRIESEVTAAQAVEDRDTPIWKVLTPEQLAYIHSQLPTFSQTLLDLANVHSRILRDDAPPGAETQLVQAADHGQFCTD